jgi:hypothetical protein
LNNPFTRYELKEPLIALHNGHLYKAQDLSLHRTVLLFLVNISPLHSAKTYIDSMGKNGHAEWPALMHILDVEVAEKQLAVIMPCESGKPLVQLLEKHSLSLAEIVEMLVTFGSELQNVQKHRLIDFSLRPSNIWLQQDGKLKVIHTWEDGVLHNPSMELSKLFYQLVTKSSHIPDQLSMFEQELHLALQKLEVPKPYRNQLVQTAMLAMADQVPLTSWVRGLKQGFAGHVGELQIHEQITATVELNIVNTMKKKRSFSLPFSKLWIGMGAFVASIVVFVSVLAILIEALGVGTTPKESLPPVVQNVSPPAAAVPAAGPPAPKSVQPPVVPADAVQVQVPALTGLTREDAEKQSLASGLRYSFFLETNNQPAGSVFRQEPAPNETVAKGSSVTFWVSKGKP